MQRVAVQTLRNKRRVRALTMVEILFCLMVFLMMTLMFAAVVPSTLRSSRYGNSYATAVQLGQHKIDQTRDLGFTKCTGAGLYAAGIVDSATPVSTSGDSNTYSFTTKDSLLSYFPAGATGTLTVEPYAPSINASGTATMLRTQITITWRDAAGPSSTYSTASVVVSL